MNETDYIISKRQYNLISILQTVLTISLFLVIFYYNFGIASVPTESMLPTLPVGSVIVYDYATPDEMDYNDVVTFFYDRDKNLELNNGLDVLYSEHIEHRKVYVKRLVGKPGDVIEIIDSYLYRNGERLYSEPEIFESMEPYTVPDGKFYCLGDNRSNSYDSIYVGAFDQNLFFGKILIKL